MVRYRNMGITWEEELRLFFSGLLNAYMWKRCEKEVITSEFWEINVDDMYFYFLKVYVEHD